MHIEYAQFRPAYHIKTVSDCWYFGAGVTILIVIVHTLE